MSWTSTARDHFLGDESKFVDLYCRQNGPDPRAQPGTLSCQRVVGCMDPKGMLLPGPLASARRNDLRRVICGLTEVMPNMDHASAVWRKRQVDPPVSPSLSLPIIVMGHKNGKRITREGRCGLANILSDIYFWVDKDNLPSRLVTGSKSWILWRCGPQGDEQYRYHMPIDPDGTPDRDLRDIMDELNNKVGALKGRDTKGGCGMGSLDKPNHPERRTDRPDHLRSNIEPPIVPSGDRWK